MCLWPIHGDGLLLEWFRSSLLPNLKTLVLISAFTILELASSTQYGSMGNQLCKFSYGSKYFFFLRREDLEAVRKN